MFVNPSAMPSFVASVRCVTRESSSTASSSFKSRWASISISGLLTWCGSSSPASAGDVFLDGALRRAPVALVVDREAALGGHHVDRGAIAVQARLCLEQQRRAKQIDGLVDGPGLRQVLAPDRAAPDRLARHEER